MKVKIDFLPEFMRLAKPLWKKYASFEQDYMQLLDELRSNPFVGTPLGEGVRKVRMTITSKGKGKSGGARVLTYCVNKDSESSKNHKVPPSACGQSKSSHVGPVVVDKYFYQ